jgi:hypothetical protein
MILKSYHLENCALNLFKHQTLLQTSYCNLFCKLHVAIISANFMLQANNLTCNHLIDASIKFIISLYGLHAISMGPYKSV